jgi:hypothetical protein
MATLAEMRRKVYTRLRDWGGDVWNEFELNQIINEAQDNFTRDTGYLRSVIISTIVDGQSVYTLTPPAGYRIGDTLSVIYYDGVRDYPALIPVSLRQLELMSPDYRHVSGSVPMYVVRNFNPETTAPTKDTFYLYPTPDISGSDKRLRVNVVLMTDGQLTSDDTEMALPERIAEEAIINYAVAEAFVRESLSAPDKADAYIKQSQYYRQRYDQAMVRAAAEAKTGFDRGMNTVRGWWV